MPAHALKWLVGLLHLELFPLLRTSSVLQHRKLKYFLRPLLRQLRLPTRLTLRLLRTQSLVVLVPGCSQ
jgi:hypothetical protein